MAGFIYIFSNPAYGRLIKIGKSAKDPEEDRLSELYTTSSPEPFTCEYWAFVDRYDEVERLVHLALRDYRKNPQREFFDVPIPAAIRTIKSVVSSLNRRSHDDLVPRIHFEKPLHEWREALRRAEEAEAKRLAEQRRREEEERQRLEEERRIEEQKRVERLAQEARKREEDRRREEEEIKRREEERRVEEQRKAELLAEQVRKREEEARRAEKEAAERLAEEHRRNEEERRIVEENQRRAALYAACLSQWKANIGKFRRLIDAEIKRNNRVWLSMLKQLGLAYGDFSYSVVDKRLAEKADFERACK